MKCFLLLSVVLLSQTFGELIDLEKIPYLRKEQYIPKAKKHIVIYSAMRVGSSVVYNLCRYLFEDSKCFEKIHFIVDPKEIEPTRKVYKTHKTSLLKHFDPKETLLVCPFRDPMKASLSIFRITKRHSLTTCFAKWLIKDQLSHLNSAFSQECRGMDTLYLYYDDFTNDLMDFLKKFENYMEIQISSDDKKLLVQALSKENVKKNIEHLNGYADYLPYSGFHGNHISLVKDEEEVQFLKELEPIFKSVEDEYEFYLNKRLQ